MIREQGGPGTGVASSPASARRLGGRDGSEQTIPVEGRDSHEVAEDGRGTPSALVVHYPFRHASPPDLPRLLGFVSPGGPVSDTLDRPRYQEPRERTLTTLQSKWREERDIHFRDPILPLSGGSHGRTDLRDPDVLMQVRKNSSPMSR